MLDEPVYIQYTTNKRKSQTLYRIDKSSRIKMIEINKNGKKSCFLKGIML